MVFYPIGSASGLDATKINHLKLAEEITLTKNPCCFEVKDGKVQMTIYKSFSDKLISIRE